MSEISNANDLPIFSLHTRGNMNPLEIYNVSWGLNVSSQSMTNIIEKVFQDLVSNSHSQSGKW